MGCPHSKDFKVSRDKSKVIDIDFQGFNDFHGQSTLITDACVTRTYTIKKVVGSGTFSDVFTTEHKVTKIPYAIKNIKLRNYESNKAFIVEVEALKKIEHPYIIKFHDYLRTEFNAYIIMELATGGDIFERIRDNRENGGKLTIHESCRVTRMITDALSYLHKNGITHRDLKAENVLYYSPGPSRVVLTDFGLSSFRGNAALSTFCGTMEYLSPEILTKKPYNKKVDVWALGCLVYFMISGCLPWSGLNLQEKIPNKPHTYNLEVWNTVPNEAKDFIDVCLQKKQELRATSSELFQHEWINENNNIEAKIKVHEYKTRQREISKVARQRKCSWKNDDAWMASLPPISKSPDDHYLVSRKRLKGDHIQTEPIPEIPTRNQIQCGDVGALDYNMEGSDSEIQPRNSPKQPYSPGDKFGSRKIFVKPPGTENMNESNIDCDLPLVLPPGRRNLEQIIRKVDILSASTGSSKTTDSNGSSRNVHNYILPSHAPRSHISTLSQMSDFVSDNECENLGMEISPTFDSNNVQTTNSQRNTMQQNIFSFPPALHNTLFTPQQNTNNTAFPQLNFDKYTSREHQNKKPTLDELFTATSSKPNHAGFRRLKSSSPTQPIRPFTLPNEFFYKDEKKVQVQNWLTSINENGTKICSAFSRKDHPKFCRNCMEGKSLAKSY